MKGIMAVKWYSKKQIPRQSKIAIDEYNYHNFLPPWLKEGNGHYPDKFVNKIYLCQLLY